MLSKEDSARSVDPTIVFAEAVPNDSIATENDGGNPGQVSAEAVIFVEHAEPIDVVVEDANPTDAPDTLEDPEDPETRELMPMEVSVSNETSSIDRSDQGDYNLLFLCCCDYRVAVVGINAAFLTILVLVDIFPQAIDQILLPIAITFVICGIYGAIFFKRWGVNIAAFYYALHMVFVILENIVDHKPYRALIRICIFSGILYAHLNMSKLMTAGIMTKQNYPNIACPETWC